MRLEDSGIVDKLEIVAATSDSTALFEQLAARFDRRIDSGAASDSGRRSPLRVQLARPTAPTARLAARHQCVSCPLT
jgi:hypothetical protein